LDGSPVAEQVLEPARALGALTGARYTLLRVVDVMRPALHDADGFLISGLDPQAKQHVRQAAQAYLDRVAGRLRQGGADVATKVVVNGLPAEAILNEARSHDYDGVALATRGHGGIKRQLLGSVADKVLRGVSVPVLVVNPRAEPSRMQPA
jgi:nucleotide-binding universal stress UspA family protein